MGRLASVANAMAANPRCAVKVLVVDAIPRILSVFPELLRAMQRSPSSLLPSSLIINGELLDHREEVRPYLTSCCVALGTAPRTLGYLALPESLPAWFLHPFRVAMGYTAIMSCNYLSVLPEGYDRRKVSKRDLTDHYGEIVNEVRSNRQLARWEFDRCTASTLVWRAVLTALTDAPHVTHLALLQCTEKSTLSHQTVVMQLTTALRASLKTRSPHIAEVQVTAVRTPGYVQGIMDVLAFTTKRLVVYGPLHRDDDVFVDKYRNTPRRGGKDAEPCEIHCVSAVPDFDVRTRWIFDVDPEEAVASATRRMDFTTSSFNTSMDKPSVGRTSSPSSSPTRPRLTPNVWSRSVPPKPELMNLKSPALQGPTNALVIPSLVSAPNKSSTKSPAGALPLPPSVPGPVAVPLAVAQPTAIVAQRVPPALVVGSTTKEVTSRKLEYDPGSGAHPVSAPSAVAPVSQPPHAPAAAVPTGGQTDPNVVQTSSEQCTPSPPVVLAPVVHNSSVEPPDVSPIPMMGAEAPATPQPVNSPAPPPAPASLSQSASVPAAKASTSETNTNGGGGGGEATSPPLPSTPREQAQPATPSPSPTPASPNVGSPSGSATVRLLGRIPGVGIAESIFTWASSPRKRANTGTLNAIPKQ